MAHVYSIRHVIRLELSPIVPARRNALEQDAAKGNATLAASELHAARDGFVRYYMPLRRRIRTALKSEPELSKKVGLAAA